MYVIRQLFKDGLYRYYSPIGVMVLYVHKAKMYQHKDHAQHYRQHLALPNTDVCSYLDAVRDEEFIYDHEIKLMASGNGVNLCT